MKRWILTLILLALPAAATAQVDRYDVGRKLVIFEKAWDAEKNAVARKRTLPPLKRALTAFFSGRLGDAGKAVDDALFALQSEAPPAEPTRWAHSIAARPAFRLIDPKTNAVEVRLVALYSPSVEMPQRVTVTCEFPQIKGRAAVTSPVGGLPIGISVPVDGLPEGDHMLKVTILAEGTALAVQEHTISVVPNLEARLTALRDKSLAATSTEAGMIERLTLKAHVKTLDLLSRGGTGETAFPAARFVAEGEAFRDAAYFDKSRAGQFWISVPTPSGGSAAIRVQVPPTAVTGKPMPLVVALHGAGGSENMFFDACGHGEVVRQCVARDWLLVATRTEGFFGGPPVIAVIDELAKRYPVERSRVFLVGHSMGAGQAISLARSNPDRIAGVACLGGGSRVGNASDQQKAVPFFVGVGSDDFALGGARGLAASLQAHGYSTVKLVEYPDIEHIVIVQAALPEVFRWFDGLIASKTK